MAPNLLFPSLFLSSLIGITLSLADPDVKMNCYPTSCGNVTGIRFPFWIPGRQPDYCGFPQFQLNCTDEGILALAGFSGAQYQVTNIFYDNQSFIIADAKLAANHCPVPAATFFSLTPFGISSKNKELYVLFNCSHAHPDNYFRIPCIGDETFGFIAGGFKPQDTVVPNSPKTCGSAVLPVLDTRGLLTTGYLLEWTVASCAECLESKGQCGYNNETESLMCICPDRIHYQSCESKSDKGKNIAIGVSAAGAGLIAAFFLGLFLYKRKRRQQHSTSSGSVAGISGILLACLIFCFRRSHLKKNEAQNIESFLEKYGSSVPKRYKYADVKRMTNSFHYKLGQGGFGSVYKGTLRDGRLVAVKVLRDCKGDGEEFVNEVASIGRTSHVNVVSLLGFCSKGSKRALIYDFMCNGSLEKFIYSEAPKTTLGWEKLYQIAIGIARGLEYLHRGCNTRIVHFDIKPHNILLDQDFCPKISDFGLAKLCPQKDSVLSMAGTRGTIGYIAPEVFSRNFGVVSSKSDVYSYGMLVLEMVGGRRNVEPGASNTSEIYFPHWVYEHLDQDGCLQACGVTNETEDIARKMILVGLWCIQTMPQNRPSMGKVIDMLEGNINDLEMPPKPYLSSPLRSVVSSIS